MGILVVSDPSPSFLIWCLLTSHKYTCVCVCVLSGFVGILYSRKYLRDLYFVFVCIYLIAYLTKKNLFIASC